MVRTQAGRCRIDLKKRREQKRKKHFEGNWNKRRSFLDWTASSKLNKTKKKEIMEQYYGHSRYYRLLDRYLYLDAKSRWPIWLLFWINMKNHWDVTRYCLMKKMWKTAPIKYFLIVKQTSKRRATCQSSRPLVSMWSPRCLCACSSNTSVMLIVSSVSDPHSEGNLDASPDRKIQNWWRRRIIVLLNIVEYCWILLNIIVSPPARAIGIFINRCLWQR